MVSSMARKHSVACPICAGVAFEKLFHYDAAPSGEVRYANFKQGYERSIERCACCGHCVSRCSMDLGGLYSGDYVNATYGEKGIRGAFERITALAPGNSDNVGRALRVDAFARKRSPLELTLLDIGSGLGVFVHRMKQAGWSCVALDPDPRAVEHAEKNIGVEGICADFLATSISRKFHLVTLNKVLEHVVDPIAMLRKAAGNLGENGLVYVEVPDGEAAASDGPEREEFFIEHLHVFSAASLALMGMKSGLTLHALERIREPSTKFTLWAFFSL